MKIKGHELGKFLAENNAITRYSLLVSILKINPHVETVCNNLIAFPDFGGRKEYLGIISRVLDSGVAKHRRRELITWLAKYKLAVLNQAGS